MTPDRISFATMAVATAVVAILFYYYLTAPIGLYLPAGTPLKWLTLVDLVVTFVAGLICAFAGRRPGAVSIGVGFGLFLAELTANHAFLDLRYLWTTVYLAIVQPLVWVHYFVAWLLGIAGGFGLARFSVSEHPHESRLNGSP